MPHGPANLPQLVVFDMAGTTVEAADHVPGAFREAFGQAGIELSDTDISSIRGKAKQAAIAELLERETGSADGAENVHRAFQETLLAHYETLPARPVAGAGRVFGWLRSRRVGTALTTGFGRAIAGLLVRQLGWGDAVDAVVCSDDVAAGRPAPDLIFRAMALTGCTDAGRVAAVGDTVSDLQAGANAGVGWNIGVLSGAHARAQLEREPHTTIVGSVADLPHLFGEPPEATRTAL